jgi:aminoglycoside phosphotransferase (APT) family kinase protein
VTDVIPGFPLAEVTDWLSRELPETINGEVPRVELITGGLSNLTYRLRLSDTSIILRRPPPGDGLPSAHDMEREYRIQTALARTSVPVPVPLAICKDPDVIGQTFYVMTDVAGSVLRAPADTETLTADARRRLSEELVETLVALHQADPDAIGLNGYGRPQGYCARQIRRWADQWLRSRTRVLPEMDELFNLLSARVPEAPADTLVHGDYRLENTIVQFQHGSPRIGAVLDWELSTLGDPLADLGMLLTYWHDVGDDERGLISVGADVTNKPGFLTTRELGELYAARTGYDLGALPFYLAFASMKLAVILEGVYSRFLSGQTIGDGYEEAGAAVPVLVARGLRLLHENR